MELLLYGTNNDSEVVKDSTNRAPDVSTTVVLDEGFFTSLPSTPDLASTLSRLAKSRIQATVRSGSLCAKLTACEASDAGTLEDLRDALETREFASSFVQNLAEIARKTCALEALTTDEVSEASGKYFDATDVAFVTLRTPSDERHEALVDSTYVSLVSLGDHGDLGPAGASIAAVLSKAVRAFDVELGHPRFYILYQDQSSPRPLDFTEAFGRLRGVSASQQFETLLVSGGVPADVGVSSGTIRFKQPCFFVAASEPSACEWLTHNLLRNCMRRGIIPKLMLRTIRLCCEPDFLRKCIHASGLTWECSEAYQPLDRKAILQYIDTIRSAGLPDVGYVATLTDRLDVARTALTESLFVAAEERDKQARDAIHVGLDPLKLARQWFTTCFNPVYSLTKDEVISKFKVGREWSTSPPDDDGAEGFRAGLETRGVVLSASMRRRSDNIEELFPPLAEGRTRLFHGTNDAAILSMFYQGIVPQNETENDRDDFGPGFYTTPHLWTAIQYAFDRVVGRNTDQPRGPAETPNDQWPCVLVLDVDLSSLRQHEFEGDEWSDTVRFFYQQSANVLSRVQAQIPHKDCGLFTGLINRRPRSSVPAPSPHKQYVFRAGVPTKDPRTRGIAVLNDPALTTLRVLLIQNQTSF